MSVEEPVILSKEFLKKLGIAEVSKVELIQELWSGYGELSRIESSEGYYILKLIEFPTEKKHPRGWASNLGHQRKVKSYRVERSWYQTFGRDDCPARMANLHGCGHVDQKEYLLLEDLNELGFKTRTNCSWEDVKKALMWLASFHRYFLGKNPKDLWPIGTYWHLDTRPDELEALDDKELKESAPLIDQKLNRAKYQTIVHGDAKLANFLFNEKEAAAVDFQYVGGGVGIKDVAYFMSSIYLEEELETYEEKCLDTYFHYLDLPEVEEGWRKLYPVAWADFYRFLKGWSPGHWKLNSYSEKMKEKALSCL